MITDVKRTGSEVEKKLKEFYEKYDAFYREGNHQFSDERIASGSMKGLEDFYRLIQVVKRNRDVVGSLIRGMSNLRPISDFKWVEEDVPEKKPPVKKKVALAPEIPQDVPGISIPELVSAKEEDING
jgi:hypothetical protein